MDATDIAGRTILVVDDERWFVETLSEGLRGELVGVEVETAGNGVEALETLSRRPIDLVVTDVNMPEMDGMALVANMVTRGIRIPVLMVTAFGSRAIELDARRSGVVSVIDKPIHFTLMVEICASTLRSWARGAIDGITLPGLLQLLEIEKRSCVVRVFGDRAHGLIQLHRGQAVHCSTGRHRGIDALSEIVTWEAPRIELGPAIRLPPDAEAFPLAAALLEGARRADEAGRGPRPVVTESALVPKAVPASPSLNASVTASVTKVADDEDDDGDALSFLFEPEDGPKAPEKPQPSAKVRELSRNAMSSIDTTVKAAMDIQGAVAVAIVDYETGMALGHREVGGFPIEVAAAGNTEVVRAKARVMEQLGIKGGIDDILITLKEQYHLIVPMSETPWFMYLALDRAKGNLALARHKLTELSKSLRV